MSKNNTPLRFFSHPPWVGRPGMSTFRLLPTGVRELRFLLLLCQNSSHSAVGDISHARASDGPRRSQGGDPRGDDVANVRCKAQPFAGAAFLLRLSHSKKKCPHGVSSLTRQPVQNPAVYLFTSHSGIFPGVSDGLQVFS